MVLYSPPRPLLYLSIMENRPTDNRILIIRHADNPDEIVDTICSTNMDMWINNKKDELIKEHKLNLDTEDSKDANRLEEMMSKYTIEIAQ